MNVRDWIISKRSSTPLQVHMTTDQHVKQRGRKCAAQQLRQGSACSEVARLTSIAPPVIPSRCGIFITAIYTPVCTLTSQTLSWFFLSHINATRVVALACQHANILVPISANPAKTSSSVAAAVARSMTWTNCDLTVCSSLYQ